MLKSARATTGYMHGLDVIRVVTAVAVVFVHTRDWFASGRQTWWLNEVLHTAVLEPLRVDSLMAWLAVSFFFVISGIVVTHAAGHERPAQFVARRAVRILPALWAVIMLAWLAVAAGFTQHAPEASQADARLLVDNLTLLNFLTGTPAVDAVTWTLVVQIAFYAFVAATIPLARRWPWLPPALGVAAVSVALSALSIVDTPAEHTARVIVGYVPVLFLGQLIALTRAGRLTPIAALGYGMAQMWLFLRGDLGSDAVPSLPGYPQIVVWIVLLTLICTRLNGSVVRARWISACAKRSYAVFLLHVPVFYLTPPLLSTTAGTTVAFFVALAALVVTSELLYRFVELPSARWYRRWEKRRDAGRSPGRHRGEGRRADRAIVVP